MATDKASTPVTVDPRAVAHQLSRTRRAQELRKDSDLLYRAATVARQQNCPALDNALTSLARTLARQARDYLRGTTTAEVKNEIL